MSIKVNKNIQYSATSTAQKANICLNLECLISTLDRVHRLMHIFMIFIFNQLTGKVQLSFRDSFFSALLLGTKKAINTLKPNQRKTCWLIWHSKGDILNGLEFTWNDIPDKEGGRVEMGMWGRASHDKVGGICAINSRGGRGGFSRQLEGIRVSDRDLSDAAVAAADW